MPIAFTPGENLSVTHMETGRVLHIRGDLRQDPLPEHWVALVEEAYVEVAKHMLEAEYIVLPWAWRNHFQASQWQEYGSVPETFHGLKVIFGMVSAPIATVKPFRGFG